MNRDKFLKKLRKLTPIAVKKSMQDQQKLMDKELKEEMMMEEAIASAELAGAKIEDIKEESTCCKLSFKTEGDETKHYECLRCSQSCDVAIKEENSSICSVHQKPRGDCPMCRKYFDPSKKEN